MLCQKESCVHKESSSVEGIIIMVDSIMLVSNNAYKLAHYKYHDLEQFIIATTKECVFNLSWWCHSLKTFSCDSFRYLFGDYHLPVLSKISVKKNSLHTIPLQNYPNLKYLSCQSVGDLSSIDFCPQLMHLNVQVTDGLDDLLKTSLFPNLHSVEVKDNLYLPFLETEMAQKKLSLQLQSGMENLKLKNVRVIEADQKLNEHLLTHLFPNLETVKLDWVDVGIESFNLWLPHSVKMLQFSHPEYDPDLHFKYFEKRSNLLYLRVFNETLGLVFTYAKKRHSRWTQITGQIKND